MENDISRFKQKDLRGLAGNAVYVGRPSIWGNPFVIGKDGSRAEVIEKYETWLMSQPQLLSKLHDLRGKILLRPGPCDADVLLRLANKKLLLTAVARRATLRALSQGAHAGLLRRPASRASL